MNSSLPPIEKVPNSSTAERTQILDLLFEPCAELHTLSLSSLREKTFATYNDLVVDIRTQLTELAESSSSRDREWLSKILNAHPRLGAVIVASEQSKMEQAKLAAGNEDEAFALAELNVEYEQTFPGLRYIIFVNDRSKSEIMQDMKSRIARRDIDAERKEAINALCDIAADRARKLST